MTGGGGDEEGTSKGRHENAPEERWRPVSVFRMTKLYRVISERCI